MRLSVLVVTLFTLAATNTAEAHWYRTPWYIHHKIHSVKFRAVVYKRNIAHAAGVLHYFSTHKQFSSISTTAAHRYIVRRSERALQTLLLSNRPAHYKGWICIHNGEGAWNANTGNNYYGGLQAHLNWYGVHRMDLLSPLDQMWAAEHALQQNGFSHSWLAGQWPNTYPPCASLF